MTPLFSTAYLPPIAYVAALSAQSEALIETQETFPKQTYRNRTEIMTAGGVRTLSVPVVRNNHSRTEEVGIDYKERWNVIHLRTIAAAYSASPYYLYYKDDLEKIPLRTADRPQRRPAAMDTPHAEKRLPDTPHAGLRQRLPCRPPRHLLAQTPLPYRGPQTLLPGLRRPAAVHPQPQLPGPADEPRPRSRGIPEKHHVKHIEQNK